jgi:hypothetical protein
MRETKKKTLYFLRINPYLELYQSSSLNFNRSALEKSIHA